jgi:hypothetical protein
MQMKMLVLVLLAVAACGGDVPPAEVEETGESIKIEADPVGPGGCPKGFCYTPAGGGKYYCVTCPVKG